MAKQEELIKKRLKQIGKRFMALRKEKGYSSGEKFAYKHNINRAQYGKYETGMDLRMSSFLKVLDAMEVTPQEFFSEGFEEIE